MGTHESRHSNAYPSPCFHEFSNIVSSMEPESAAKWTAEIGGPTLCQSALREVGESWLHRDPDAGKP